MTQKTTTAFLAPDSASHADGVAGQAWRRNSYRVGIGPDKLPDLRSVKYVSLLVAVWYNLLLALKVKSVPALRYKSDSHAIRNYADATHCQPRFVWQRIKRKIPCPTSLVAVPLDDKNRDPWGVLVIDSCNDYECIDINSRNFRSGLQKLVQQLHSLGVMDKD